MNRIAKPQGFWIGRTAAAAVAALVSGFAGADVVMGNSSTSADAPFGAAGDTFSWYSTIQSYDVDGWPALDLDAYWLNVIIDGTILDASGDMLVDDYGDVWSDHSVYTYQGDWMFELVDQTTGASNVIEMGTFSLDAAWGFLNTPYVPQLYAELNGTFYAEPGEVFFPNGYGPVDFGGLQITFDGWYDYDSTLLSFTLSAPNSQRTSDVAVVPEPTSMALLGMGVSFMVLRTRRPNAARSQEA